MASNKCMAGRPILWRIYVPPVTIRVIPENEIPPAWRVDIYLKKGRYGGIWSRTNLTGYEPAISEYLWPYRHRRNCRLESNHHLRVICPTSTSSLWSRRIWIAATPIRHLTVGVAHQLQLNYSTIVRMCQDTLAVKLIYACRFTILSHIFMDTILKVYQHKRAVYKKSESNKKRPLIFRGRFLFLWDLYLFNLIK